MRNNILRCRLERLLTQEELAKLTELTRIRISELESSETPTVSELCAIAKALKISPASLVPIGEAKRQPGMGVVLALCRKEKNLTVLDLAKTAETTTAIIEHLELGLERRLSEYTLRKLAAALDLPPDFFVSEKKNLDRVR